MLNEKIKVWIIAALALGSIFLVFNMKLNLGLDLQGGIRMVLEAQDTKEIKADQDAVSGVIGVIRSRVDALGVAEPVIQQKGDRQIVVELPGIKDTARAIAMVGDTALLEFVESDWAPEGVELTTKDIKLLAGADARLGYVELYNKEVLVNKKPILLKKTAMTGNDLKWAGPGTDQFGKPIVSLEFTPEGAKKFYDVTARSVGRPLAILLDGKIISAPNVNEPIAGGRAQISGGFTIKEMQDLVIKLKAGALPVPVEIVETKIIGPTLGKDSIDKSKIAGLVGFIMVCLFMIMYYRVPGAISAVALLLYVIFDLAILILLQATLTLPGIAGFIITIGMAVDANVIIFEKLKEEMKKGNTLLNAIEASFSRSFLTIVDSNLTTIIGAIVLFWLGTGSIKGFAVTLITGILVSMLTAIFVTKQLLLVSARANILKEKNIRS